MPTQRVEAAPNAKRSLSYKATAWLIAGLTLLIAMAEGCWAKVIGSNDLFKDALSFGYDIALNAVAAFVFGRGARIERLSAFVIGGLLIVTGVNGLFDLWADVMTPEPTTTAEVATEGIVSVVTAGCTVLALLRFRADENPLIKATWLNARNDAVAAFLTGSLAVAAHEAAARWPEYALETVGIVLSFQAAFVVLHAAWNDDPNHAP